MQIKDLKQGDKFKYEDIYFMRVDPFYDQSKYDEDKDLLSVVMITPNGAIPLLAGPYIEVEVIDEIPEEVLGNSIHRIPRREFVEEPHVGQVIDTSWTPELDIE